LLYLLEPAFHGLDVEQEVCNVKPLYPLFIRRCPFQIIIQMDVNSETSHHRYLASPVVSCSEVGEEGDGASTKNIQALLMQAAVLPS